MEKFSISCTNDSAVSPFVQIQYGLINYMNILRLAAMLSAIVLLFCVLFSFVNTFQRHSQNLVAGLLPLNTTFSWHCSKISRHGISWHFKTSRPCGQFANKDWWVVGPVTIVRITPDFNGSQNGWSVNPVKGVNSYDKRIPHNKFIADDIPSLPYKAEPNQSIVKAASSARGECRKTDSRKHKCYLKTVAVLTILEKLPPKYGRTLFRPPYVGSNKPLYDTAKLRTDLLPSYRPVRAAPSLKWVEQEFSYVQFDHWKLWTGRYMHPSDNMPQYGSNIAIATNEAALRLMLNDPLYRKYQALVNYTQAGIDYYHMMKTGSTWRANGGHFVGRKLPIVFAALMLDNLEMQRSISATPDGIFSEDGHTYFGKNKVALFGQDCGERHYWKREITKKGRRDCRDPYGLIDGGGSEIGEAYQKCCTAHAYKGAALAALLLPNGVKIWNHAPFFKYVDRWVNHGVWSKPDSCRMQSPEVYAGKCVKGSGRFPEIHGKGADSGYYQSRFVNNMWTFYRKAAKSDASL